LFQLTTPGNFAIGGGFKLGKGKFYNGSVPDDYVLKPGDLLVTMTDLSKAADSLGYAGVVPKTKGITWLHNQRVGLISIKPGAAVSLNFLHYLMRSPDYRNWVISTATGSTVKHTSPSRICEFDFLLPPIDHQKWIAETLGELDDCITLLRETNSTLEAIVQALFKSWFVDFDPVRAKSEGKLPESMDEATAVLFPDAFDETELGMVPRGWEVKAIGEILNRPRVTKRYTKDQVQKIGNSPVYEQGASILLGFHNDEPSCNATPEMPLFIFGDHTCVTKLSCEPFDVSQNVIVLEGSVRNSIWTYFAIKGKQKFEEYRRHWMELIAKKVVVPPSALCDFYSDVATPHQLKIDANLRKIQTLTNMRDTLLPRLISGQLRIVDAEAEIKKVSA
jgi:type I restriction enzyme S subunit